MVWVDSRGPRTITAFSTYGTVNTRLIFRYRPPVLNGPPRRVWQRFCVSLNESHQSPHRPTYCEDGIQVAVIQQTARSTHFLRDDLILFEYAQRGGISGMMPVVFGPAFFKPLTIPIIGVLFPHFKAKAGRRRCRRIRDQYFSVRGHHADGSSESSQHR